MIYRIAIWMTGLAAWGASMIFVLQQSLFVGLTDRNYCGPWGCGPPVEALLSFHAFWLVFFAGPVAVLSLMLPPRRLASAGFAISVASAALTIAFLLQRRSLWLARELDSPQYAWAFARHELWTLVDFPIVQFFLAGLVMMAVGLTQVGWQSVSRRQFHQSAVNSAEI
ncbi:hypothetical protein [Stratiformator vulcanicus]|uniref:Uncharacterized protein n=1 Tax=Stratiformator vulcanicus TaxID=2527980 RepID=A0A517QYE3_9PLAN|nr:hypothetical protein [Stratiformator vulcanicus]QDT36655.1 hypothetical protein Pan189_10160 [Stratiformator vulcanicus]